jgi:hypothetical protein
LATTTPNASGRYLSATQTVVEPTCYLALRAARLNQFAPDAS